MQSHLNRVDAFIAAVYAQNGNQFYVEGLVSFRDQHCEVKHRDEKRVVIHEVDPAVVVVFVVPREL